MNNDTLVKIDLEACQRTQERIQFYFITLTFTLLALSIQTGVFSNNPVQTCTEILGWIAFLISGLAGLHRMIQLPIYYKLSVHINALNENIMDAEKIKHEQNTNKLLLPKNKKEYDIDEYIVEQQNGIKHFETKIEKLDKHLKPVIYTHRICMILGIILIMTSRSIHGISKLENLF